ncbi:MAG: exodeoxyribonuclease V subunit gamma, partial [Desulfobacterales bacterium]
MPGLTLYTSNRLEVLALELADRLRRPGDPLQTDIIIVQSRGMERWLSLAIARRNGIAANCQFPFPQAFIDKLFADLFDYNPAEDPFETGVLTFMIMRDLPALVADNPAFDDLRTYLQNDSRGVKRYQLAAEMADLLDQYLIFRPDMLLAWERDRRPGRDDPFPWQRILWKALTSKDTSRHRAAFWRDLVTGEIPKDGAAPGLPGHVSLFGVSYLPPYYLQVLESLARVMTIDIYQLNPCREYWADIASDREMDRIRRRLPENDRSADPRSLHLEIGNRLLASMGGHGRAFHTLLADLDCPIEERFEDVIPDTLLKAVQHDLLNLIDRGAKKEDGDFPAVDTVPDLSIQVHACHGPMREIEVLHDQLLALLHRHPDLEPRDILVLTPDIELYAPYIQAVFGAQTDERLHLPFSIADRPLENASPLVEALDRLLDLRASRFTRSEILTLLEFGPLRQQFDITETDLALIADWTDQVHIRWGLDGASKTAWNLPAVDANTWREGLDRLFLGYTMQDETERLFQNVLPDGNVQGSQVVVLGRLSTLIESLTQFARDLETPRTWERWHRRLNQALADFFVRDQRFEYDFQVLERLLGEMQRSSAVAGMHEPVDLDVVRAYLRRRMSQESYRGGFIGGGITFGALLPMRSIPAAIICLVGMNHDSFPRLDRPRNFDLMALNPRLGDRSRRNDDRYLFLETLISARRCVYISYTGFDVHDNSIRPPSVLVSELLDYLQEGFGLAEDDLVTSHRLQAFAPAYFKPGDGRLFSFNRDHARSARNLATPSKVSPDAGAFLSSALAPGSLHFWSLTPEDLRDALGHPCRFLMEKRLNLQMRAADKPDADRE